jgi:hypothetical protein
MFMISFDHIWPSSGICLACIVSLHIYHFQEYDRNGSIKVLCSSSPHKPTTSNRQHNIRPSIQNSAQALVSQGNITPSSHEHLTRIAPNEEYIKLHFKQFLLTI